MPIDTEKMGNVSNNSKCLSAVGIFINSIYILLIFISLVWNAYNTHEHQILAEKQLKLETILSEILPSTSTFSLLNQIDTGTKSSFEQWFTKAFHLIQQLTIKDMTNISNSNIINEPYRVRILVVEMLY